ncbi:succinate dehydrogenase, cytochrome b556 subunit [Reinekea blandensis]|uniref:Succinate dehydrogenase cytochrome b556 subunit n=1 Tax=Reinekea blandensis MED297 TaxID=314283 RepID=A4BDM4_9GAMM|nr:succinate dehydrogenase, cytochrome b556 subunit [Reinekea blandensis]EAR09633.1 putative succinate dehydrogenase, hydrophobic subunit [Reinekea blandensis MED297]
MKNNRPVNLDLTTIRMPVTAIASITHRVTGVGLFVAVGFLLWALSTSLESAEGFRQVQGVMSHWFAKFITWGIVSFVVYHLIAGIKHLFMDAGYFETKETGPVASKVVLVLSAIGIVLVGVWVW